MTSTLLPDPPARDSNRRNRLWLYGAGGAVIAFGVFALWKAFEIAQPSAYRPMGPRVFPVIISAGLIVIGVAFVAQVWRRGDDFLLTHVDEEIRTAEHGLAALVIVLLALYAAAFEPVGYVVSTSLFLPAVARALGSRRVLRDVVVAILLACTAFLLFTRLLNIDLPNGVMGDML